MSVRRLACAVIVCGAVFVLGCGVAVAAAPEAPELSVLSPVSSGSVNLRGVLDPGLEGGRGSFELGEYEFLYRASKSECQGESATQAGFSLGAGKEEVNETIGGLSPNTFYTVCLLARTGSKGETVLSAPVTFRTAVAPEAPEALAASGVSSTGATLRGVVDPSNSAEAEPGSVEFRYRASGGECEGEGEAAVSAPAYGGGGRVEVQEAVGGLAPGREYAFCVRVVNEAGEAAVSPPVMFTTATQKPSVGSESVSNLGIDSATVTAQVDTGGAPATYAVEYGTTASYGSRTATVNLSSGSSQVAVGISGLLPDTEYHYRYTVANEDGIESGVDMVFTTYPPGSGGQLPDSRVYEMVTPLANRDAEVYEPGAEPYVSQRPFMASLDGNAIAYIAEPSEGGNGAGGDDLGDEYRAVRSPQGGWTQTNITPLGSSLSTEYEGFSEDLSTGYVSELTVPPVVESEAPSVPHGVSASEMSIPVLYARRFEGQLFSPLFTTTPMRPNGFHRQLYEFGSEADKFDGFGSTAERAIYMGSSTDASRAFFEANDSLMGGSGTLEEELHSDVAKEVQEVTQQRNLEAEANRLKEEGFSASSEQEKEEKFAAGRQKKEEAAALALLDTRDELYMSDGGVLSLVNVLPDGRLFPGASFPLSDDHAVSSDGSRVYWVAGKFGAPGIVYLRVGGSSTVQVSDGPAIFWAASRDGRYAFYVESGVLWRFDAETGARARVAGDAGGALAVLGINETGEAGAYVYFVSTEAVPGSRNGAGQAPVEGGDNVYVREPDPSVPGGSRIVFIGTISNVDGKGEVNASGIGGSSSQPGFDWAADIGGRTVDVTPDGRALTFIARENLTGHPYPQEGFEEVYVYDAGNSSLVCASCRSQASGGLFTQSQQLTHKYRWISDNGDRVFFDSYEPLVAQDTNGLRDVYEWERDGTGECAEKDGCVYLLSNGSSEGGARLIDASASGDDVFFVTRQKLVEPDKNENRDLYDVRVNGVRPVSPPQCSGTGCQGVPAAAPIFQAPSSVTFNGVGNFTPPPPKTGRALKKTQRVVAQRLAGALRVCRREHAKKSRSRASCEAHARKRYGNTSRSVIARGR